MSEYWDVGISSWSPCYPFLLQPTSSILLLGRCIFSSFFVVLLKDLTFFMQDSYRKHYWFADSFTNRARMNDRRSGTCSVNRFSIKSDKTVWLQKPESSKQFCLIVESMPHKKFNDLDGKKIEIHTGMLQSKNLAVLLYFVFCSPFLELFGWVYIGITKTVHKVLMRRVLSDIYRITQEKFQYHGV